MPRTYGYKSNLAPSVLYRTSAVLAYLLKDNHNEFIIRRSYPRQRDAA